MEREDTSYTVGEVARLAGVTVRTLHHYDEIGLLTPGGRSEAGYRRYSDRDIGRLRDVLAYRELGLALDDIAAIIDEPGSDPIERLRRQRALVAERIERLERIAAAIDRELEADQMDIDLTPEERFEVFGDHDPDEHADEAHERWGGTDAYAQSRRRTATYGKEEWLRIRDEAADVERRLAAALLDGVAADAPEAMDVAEEHRLHISRWFYDCPHEMHASLGRMYVDDPRFAAHYDEAAPGLAAYVRDAVLANAARAS